MRAGWVGESELVAAKGAVGGAGATAELALGGPVVPSAGWTWSPWKSLLDWWSLVTPKRRTSHRRKRVRNIAKALKPFVSFSECELCGEYKRPHQYCDPRDPCRRKAEFRLKIIRRATGLEQAKKN